MIRHLALVYKFNGDITECMSVPPPGWSAFCMCILLHTCYMLNIPKCQGRQGTWREKIKLHSYLQGTSAIYMHVQFPACLIFKFSTHRVQIPHVSLPK